MRAALRLIIIILVVLLASVAVLSNLSKPYDRTIATYKEFEVGEGDDLDKVAAGLEDEGIVGNASVFSALARLSLMSNFKSELYYLSPSMNSFDIARTMSRGITTSSGISIPAGYSLEQIASSLARDGLIDEKAFMEAAASDDLQEIDFVGSNKLGSKQIEGFLFPGDYQMNSNADEGMIIMTMLNQFANFFNEDYKARADEMGLSVRELVYIASLIETETTVSKEKAAVSAVIHNRYNIGMISKKEIKQAPLCSPGEDSIIAALYPEDNDNIYYVYSPKLDGSHVFTADKEEYERMLQEYRDAVAENSKDNNKDNTEDSKK